MAWPRDRLFSVASSSRRAASSSAAMEADRRLTYALDDPEDRFALLLADRVAEDPAKQADVIAQREVLFGNFDRVEACHIW